MKTEGQETEVDAIKSIISRQFSSLSWDQENAADWETFKSDFLPHATLFPSARPVAPLEMDSFVDRMKRLASTDLQSFHENVLGSHVSVFGNVAVAVVACENTENDQDVNRNVEMMLLVKDGGTWKIAAQAWDKATEANPVPKDLLTGP